MKFLALFFTVLALFFAVLAVVAADNVGKDKRQAFFARADIPYAYAPAASPYAYAPAAYAAPAVAYPYTSYSAYNRYLPYYY